jgi:hypothetical protein
MRPFKNIPFCPISASDSDFSPRNTQRMPAGKIFVFFELELRLNIKFGFNWAGKIEYFKVVSQ